MAEKTFERTADAENLMRLLARVSVGAGGMFWIVAAFAGPFVFENTNLADSIQTALWPFMATVAILAIGWFYEHLAAVLLSAASAAVLVWGVIYDWEPGVWFVMVVVLMAPMMIAAVLFLFASRAGDERSAASEPHPDARATAIPARRSA